MATIDVHSGGSWSSARPSVHSAGAWHTVQNGYVHSGGSWQQFFENLVLLSGSAGSIVNTSSTAGTYQAIIDIVGDGTTIENGSTGNPNWATPTGTYTTYSCRFRLVSPVNTTNAGATLNTWLPLTSTQAFKVQNSTTTVEATGSMYVDISHDGGTTVDATFNFAYDVGKV